MSKSPSKHSSHQTSSYLIERNSYNKIIFQDLESRSRMRAQLEKMSVKKDSQMIEKLRKTRPSTEAIQKDYRVRKGVKSTTPYNKDFFCSSCKEPKCICDNRNLAKKNKFEEIDSESDERMSIEQMINNRHKTVFLLKSLYS